MTSAGVTGAGVTGADVTTAVATAGVDEAVPALDLLLDVDRLRAWLAQYDEVLVRRPYLRHKPGTSCVAALELVSGRAFVYGVSETARPKLDKLRAQAPPGSVRALDQDVRMVLATVAADRDLPAARDVSAAVAALQLGDLSADDHGRWHHPSEGDVRVLVHKPQRRLVGLLGGDPGGVSQPVVLRAYRRARLAGAVQRHRAASRVPGIRTADVVATSGRHGLLALTHLPGQSLDVLLAQGGSLRTVLWETGRALARLHNGRPGRAEEDLERARMDSGRAAVSRAAAETAAQLSGLCPDLAPRVRQVLDELAAGAPVAGEPVFCHGDFSTDQVVVDGEGRPALIDWDHAGWGDPASDLASAEVAGLAGAPLEDFLEGYGELRRLPAQSRWHLAHARLMRALDPFRSGQPGWRTEVAANVASVERTLGGVLR